MIEINDGLKLMMYKRIFTNDAWKMYIYDDKGEVLSISKSFYFDFDEMGNGNIILSKKNITLTNIRSGHPTFFKIFRIDENHNREEYISGSVGKIIKNPNYNLDNFVYAESSKIGEETLYIKKITEPEFLFVPGDLNFDDINFREGKNISIAYMELRT